MAKTVREPIQVYLTPEEREQLDRAARALGVSRSEVLRRGISAVGTSHPGHGVLRDLAHEGYVTPPLAPPGAVPPRARTTPFDRLMRDLDEDRRDR